MWRDLGWVLGVVVGLAAGCAPAPPAGAPARGGGAGAGGVELRTDRSDYRAGDPVALTVVNHAGDTVTFNPCTRALEAERDSGWAPVAEPQRICTMEAWLLAPGQTRTGATELPAELAPGRIRIVLAVSTGGASPARLEVRSGPVTIQR
jgi:hypothetical protein